jgi:hypothetical protein
MASPTNPGKVRHCPYCGDDMGFIENRYFDRTDPCGKTECNRDARHAAEAEREDAHDRLDHDMGWN